MQLEEPEQGQEHGPSVGVVGLVGGSYVDVAAVENVAAYVE